MIFTVLTLLFSVFGAGLQGVNYVTTQTHALNVGADPRVCPDLGEHMGSPLQFEINDVPNNITLQIDGYEIAYPIKTEILGAASHQRDVGSSMHPHALPRYYILAEPILYRRTGDSEWKSLYDPTSICNDYDFVALKCKPPKETEK